MDLRITRDELRKTDDGYELMIYLSSDETEFAKELGRNGNNDRVLEEDVRQYVQKKYPNMKVNVARLMLGGLLLTSVPLAATNIAAAAAPNDYQQTSDWAKAAVQRLTDEKVITGDEKGNFNPQSTMDRNAFVTMLVRALNLETVTPDNPTFKDVSKDNWAYQYVETAYANGLVKGDTATTFAPGAKITREQMATIFVRALGLTPEDIKGQGDELTFADKASIATYARDAVGFAVKNNLLKGVENNRFAGGDVATREQVAVLADRFLTNHDALVTAAGELKAPTMTASMEKNDLDTILLTFNKAVDNLTAENVTVTGPNGEKIAVNSVTLGADKKTATVETGKLTAGLGYTVNVKTDTLNRSDSVTPESDVVTVADATALNNKQVSVTFSGKVDPTTASQVANYAIGATGAAGTSPESATLLDDGKTVLLVLADGQVPDNQTDRDVLVQNVKDVNGATIATATKSTHFLDTTIPTVQGATTVGPNTVKVTFSEPVRDAGPRDFLLDNGTYSVQVVGYNPVDNSVTVRTGVDLSEGTHSLLINSTSGNTPTMRD
ncbi:MAG: S-layer homology domain-containing protein, partial [Tumebacillaceae bacterium]